MRGTHVFSHISLSSDSYAEAERSSVTHHVDELDDFSANLLRFFYAEPYMKIRLLVANDLSLFGHAIASLFSGNEIYEIIEVTRCNAELVHLCRIESPDLLITYIPANYEKIISIISEIKAMYRSVKILAITDTDRESINLKLFKAGVNGIFDSGSSPEFLHQAVQYIYGENALLKVQNNNIEKFDIRPDIDKFFIERKRGLPKLTTREKEVLLLISEGLTTKQISERLSLSKRTVDYFRGALIQKLHVRSSAGLIRRAIMINSEII